MSRAVTLLVLTAVLAGDAIPHIRQIKRNRSLVLCSALQLTDTFLHAYPDEPIGEPFLEMIRQARPGVRILVFLGTWCSDSKRDVPRFLRIADGTGMTDVDYELHGLDRKKTSPDGLEQKYAIERVPTFIILRGGKEIGRIVEAPRTTLEGDILNILANPGS